MNNVVDVEENCPTSQSSMLATYLQQAEVYKVNGEWAQALSHYQQALDLDAKDWRSFNGLGDILLNLERVDEAVVAYRRSLQLNPEFDWAYHNLAVALHMLGKLEEADLYYDNLADLNPAFWETNRHDVQVQQQFGDYNFRRENWTAAAAAYRLALSLNPGIAWNYINLGRASKYLDQWDEAIDCFRKAIRLNPDWPEAYYILCQTLIEQKRLDEALEVYQDALAAGLISPEIVQLVELVQTDLEAKNQTLAQQIRWEKSLAGCQRSLEREPQPLTYRVIGELLLKLERWDESIAAFHQALALDPNLPGVYDKLVQAFVQLQRWDQAAIAHRQVLLLNQQLNLSTEALVEAVSQQLTPVFLKQTPASAILKAMFELFQVDSERWQEILTSYEQVPILYPELTKSLEQLADSCMCLLTTLDCMSEVEKLVLPCSETPLVSVVIPVYNKIDYTYRCLQSLAKQLDPTLAIEIMVVNDCSTDETEAILQHVEGLILITNEKNSGFICSCNNGAAQAKGKYIYFLNNDTEIRPGSIEELVAVLDADETVGAVGSKLVYPNGQLQEAGGVIWNTAEGWNYGRMQNPFDPQYNYLRPADYCSAASLLVRRWAFEALDGFEKAFIPAYYEDTDLCFGIRNILNLKVVCQPKSEIIHYEGISSGTSTTSGVKRYQVINHAKFQEKWQIALADHFPNQGAELIARASRRLAGKQTILIINPYPLCHDKESGARRLFELVKIFKQLDCHVIFAPENGYKEEPYTSQLQNLGVEVLYTQDGYGVPVVEQIVDRLGIIDIAWICFPDLTQKYLPIFREYSHIKVIYDTIDLHYLRLKRAWEMLPIPRDVQKAREWSQMRTLELEMAKQADLTLTVTAVEQDLLQKQAVPNVAVVPNIHRPYRGEKPGFAERVGLLFIGGYNHPPNVDGVIWLCETIMPYVWQQLPDISVTLLGSNPPASVKQLAEQDQRITVPGFIEDVTLYFLSHRLFVAPLRYGAGMKGKVGQSLEYGLPLVSTTVGVEGMGLSEDHVLVADTTEDFAYQILRLYADQELWERLAANSFSGIEPFTAEAVKVNLQSLISQLTQS